MKTKISLLIFLVVFNLNLSDSNGCKRRFKKTIAKFTSFSTSTIPLEDSIGVSSIISTTDQILNNSTTKTINTISFTTETQKISSSILS
jgi:hypothetical protein